MKTKLTIFQRVCAVILSLLLGGHTYYDAAAAETLANSPLFLTQGSTPLVMLDMSRDHQLYFKAYDDYSDVDGDHTLDMSYKNGIKYYGYFDNAKCYVYSSTSNYFVPSSNMTATGYCNGSVTNNDLTVTVYSNQWSGNFLNWAAMTRIDAVRKILYGGFRSTDTGIATVLERSFLPNDAHSFAKYYNGSDVAQLTPFTTVTNGTNQTDGITLCNTTYDSTNSLLSQNVTAAPLIRVAKGNFSLWSSNERWQCRWSEEKSASNGNVVAKSSIKAASSNPSKATDGLKVSTLGPDYNVRVQVCVPSTKFGLGNEKCKAYPTTNATYTGGVLKPIGLLQTYGDNGYIFFGLMTGSYSASQSGGVLRRTIGSMASEINVTGDGTFNAPLATGGILQSLNALRIYGYNYGDGTYFGVTGSDNCSWGLNSFTNGKCSNWGNPQSEMYLETLRYLSGKTANATFNVDDSTRFSGLSRATWSPPINGNNYCAPLSVIQFNASTSSYDGDELTGFTDLTSATTLDFLTDSIGEGEGIKGNSYFVGQIAGATAPNNNQLCTAKVINNLSKVQGTCPDSPRLQGTYQIGGLAYFAHTTGISGASAFPSLKQKVRTYGVALSPATPKIVVPVPGSTSGKTITILPACRNASVGGNCAIVDFKIVSQSSTTTTNSGKLYVNWEDSEQGGDYDQDMWGIITYQVTATNVSISTQAVAKSTGDKMGFGYVVSGTIADGFYAHSGINGFANAAPTVIPTGATILGCGSCSDGDAATQNIYPIGTSTTKSLEQPLYYAAKWGGFNDSDADNKPNVASEWDSNGDTIPDGYFYATNPAQLEQSLSAALLKVAEDTGSASAVATNSTHLDSNTLVFQAKFNSKDWSGQLLAYPLNTDGTFGTARWDASAAGLIPVTGRKLFTWNGTAGAVLQWSNLTPAQQTALTVGGEVTPTNAQNRLLWLMGDRSNEQPSGALRKRTTLLGDIVDSDPAFSGGDDFGYTRLPGSVPGQSTYSAYVAVKKARTAVILVGSNDGMLHAFNAATGAELFAYMPSTALLKAIALTRPDYGSTVNPHQYFVDGSLYVDDVYIGGQWRTYVFGAMGAGGRAVFALDITNPDSFSASDVKFEMTNADDSRLGFVMGQPQTSLLADGSWSAIFGNGYNADDDKAYLFVVNLADKTKKTVIPTDTVHLNNGLSGPELLINADRTVTTAYAGDLLGHLWKFDLSATSAASWSIAYGGPLFTAVGPNSEVQPITATPTLGINWKKNNDVMVYFGTGQYFAVGDNIVSGTPPVQSFYAIDDGGVAISSRSSLYHKVISGETTSARTINDGAFPWASYNGWYVDLIGPSGTKLGERIISRALLVYDRLIFTTFIPSQGSCTFGGSGWLMDIGGVDAGNTRPIIGNSGNFLSVAVVKTPGFIESGNKIYFPSSSLRGDNTIPPGGSMPYGTSHNKLSWWQLR